VDGNDEDGHEHDRREGDEHGTGNEPAHDNDSHHQHDHEHEHRHHHETDIETLGVALATISSSRTLDEDRAGDAIVELLEEAGHEVVTRELIPDGYDVIQRTVDAFIDREDVDVVITTGGTGVSPDDVTIEAVTPLVEKALPGFGELFRRLSYEEIGTRVVGTRASAGVTDGAVVFCLPGSENAARLGTASIVLEVGPHLAGLADRRHDDEEDESKEGEA
jgi:molybdenum cofactor biosynthesis protein B